MRRAHAMPFGAAVLEDGRTRFSLWAPFQDTVTLVLPDLDASIAMQREDDGRHTLVTERAPPGSRYMFALADGTQVPDPASRRQPEDVHGPSEVVDPCGYDWAEATWRGRPWHETVLYELHVGTFTPEGTFVAVIDKLDYLVELGVSAIELMPVADFPGRCNWGYDGAYLFAPDTVYGRPEDLKALVDAAHARGLMVILDVVYNHFGPEGNYFGSYAPLFTERHKTPWGAAINYDGKHSRPVREFMIHNALYWLEEFHLDGLRLDAVHAIIDDSTQHLLDELAQRVRSAFPADRHIHLMLENDANQAGWLDRSAAGMPRRYNGQWADDLHHGLHTAITGEANGYYLDYHGDIGKLGRALAEGFTYQGDPSPFKKGEPRGEPSAHLPPTAFVSFLQNHDQIGNRALGDRIAALASAEACRAAAALYLMSPSIPLLFMGEEWGTLAPFPFFCDFGPELADAVRRGRSEEFAEFSAAAGGVLIPDPTAEATFARAKLSWTEPMQQPHAAWLDWYRRVLALRRERIMPLLPQIRGRAGSFDVIGPMALQVMWRLDDGRSLRVLANLSDEPVDDVAVPRGEILWREAGDLGSAQAGHGLGAWEVTWLVVEPTALDRLADRMGIEPAYGALTGGTVHTRDDTKRALLATMGIDVPDEHAAEMVLARLEASDLAQPLPPVLVTRRDGPRAVKLNLPAGSSVVQWILAEERGGQQQGAVAFEELRLQRRRQADGRVIEARLLLLPTRLPLGYHSLQIAAEGINATMAVIVVPTRCYLPADIVQGHRLWGIAAQLYSVRSAADWGMGDFADLSRLIALAGSRGASMVGLNPLHALFLDRPEDASPYSPASRLHLNPLYIDVTAIPELAGCQPALEQIASPAFKARMEQLRAKNLVDYRSVAETKLPLLEAVHASFDSSASSERRRAFEAFRSDQGQSLERFCLFQALREHFAAEDPAQAYWRNWPEPMRDPRSPAVASFAAQHRRRIDFLAWLQWIAETQLEAAAAAAREQGMTIGLYRDLAVGADGAGAETWANPTVVVAGARVGAPPDDFNPMGQNWGLPPFDPRALQAEAYRSFIELLRANMRHAGALRIDHVMALQHLYWIPAESSAGEGAYVAYPFEDLLGILALESERHRCIVVGEDLGTVAQGFRERMAEAAVLSYRMVFFEMRKDGSLVAPDNYPRSALATIGSHDLATLRGWWEGHDIDLKAELGLYGSPEAAQAVRQLRAAGRDRFVHALHDAGVSLPEDVGADSPWTDTLLIAAYGFLAATKSALAMVQLDDLAGNRDQVNLPGTYDQYPNWRRKLAMTVEELAEDRAADAAMVAMSAGRSRDRHADLPRPISCRADEPDAAQMIGLPPVTATVAPET